MHFSIFDCTLYDFSSLKLSSSFHLRVPLIFSNTPILMSFSPSQCHSCHCPQSSCNAHCAVSHLKMPFVESKYSFVQLYVDYMSSAQARKSATGELWICFWALCSKSEPLQAIQKAGNSMISTQRDATPPLPPPTKISSLGVLSRAFTSVGTGRKGGCTTMRPAGSGLGPANFF